MGVLSFENDKNYNFLSGLKPLKPCSYSTHVYDTIHNTVQCCNLLSKFYEYKVHYNNNFFQNCQSIFYFYFLNLAF